MPKNYWVNVFYIRVFALYLQCQTKTNHNRNVFERNKDNKTQTKSRDMKVILQGGFTYKAEYLIKEEAYAKLLSAAETFGKDHASTMLGLYLERNVHNLNGVDK